MSEALKSLTKNEVTVLYWKCKGLKHPQIAGKLGYSTDWVQLHMSNVYLKLGFDKKMHWTKRVEILEKEICPQLPKDIENWKVEEEVSATEEPETQSEADPEMMALVLYDEKQIETVKNASIIPPVKETIVIKERTKSQKTFGRFVFSILAAVILSLLGLFVYNLGRGTTPAPQIVIITATFIPVTDTPLPTETSAIPTDTPIPTPTATPIPTNTPVPTEFIPPADGILFQDDFESGDLSAWTQVNGQWLVSNGELTVLDDGNDSYKWIALKRPEWKNYILSLTVYQPYQGAAAQSDVLVTVRNNGPQPKYIGVPVDNFGKVYWAFIGSDMFDNDVIAGNKFENSFETGSTMELEMQGNTYILRVNGRELQRITISGYDSGGISLGADCSNTLGCAKFDNVKVTYLP